MSEHYTDGRRWSYISQAWIFADGWNDREEIARLEAKVRELEERLVDYDAAASECEGQSVLTTLRALKQYGMQLEREKADLEAKLRQVEEERDALLSEKGPAADYWGRACARVLDREKAAWQSRDQAREKLRQAEAERDQLRARVGELEEALRELSQRVSQARTMAGSYYIYAPDMDAVVERAKHALEER